MLQNITNTVLSHVTVTIKALEDSWSQAVLCNKISLSGGVNLMRTETRPKCRAAFAVLTLSEKSGLLV